MTDDSAPAGRGRTIAGAVLAPLGFVVTWALPLPLEDPAHRLAAIFVAVIVLWVTEVIPIAMTALLIAPAMLAMGVTDDPKKAFAGYADPLLYLFVGGFMIAHSMSKHGLDRRLAFLLVASGPVAGAPGRVRIALVVGAFLLTMWISNTAAAAIVVPIVLGMARTDSSRDRAVAGTVLAVVYCCSLGGLGTPVGSPPNLITMRLLQDAGLHLSFLGWMQIGLPMGLLGSVAAIVICWRLMPPEAGTMDLTEARAIVRQPWSRGEQVTLAVFLAAVVGWTVPGVLEAVGVDLGWADGLLDGSVVALLCASVLFAVPDGTGGRVLEWHEATRIDWGVIVLFGGGIALGGQMDQTGLSRAIGAGFIELTGVESLWGLVVVCAVISLLLTEVASNTATATMLVPIAIGMARELGVKPIAPVIAVGLAASCGFMLPIATGPNAIAYATGRITQGAMIRTGILLDAVCLVIVIALVLTLAPLFGWT